MVCNVVYCLNEDHGLEKYEYAVFYNQSQFYGYGR